MVPSLGLGVFGVATSTCDLRGDGDAVAFPMTAALVPAVARVQADRDAMAQAAVLPDPAVVASVAGHYCSADPTKHMTIAVEQIPLPSAINATTAATAAALVLRPAPSVQGYSFVLAYVGNASAVYGVGATEWRRIMGPELWLPASDPGCSPGTTAAAATAATGEDKGLCPISCMRKMSRGSGEAVFFYTETEGPWKGHMRMEDPGGGNWCIREAAANPG